MEHENHTTNGGSESATKRDMPRSVDIAYRKLKDDILSGELVEGDALVEHELAKRIGVSRTPLREALAKLRLEGLIVMKRYSKNYVAYFSDDDIKATIEIGAMLEGYAAARAATRITPEALARLDELEKAMTATLEMPDAEAEKQFYSLNAEFHHVIMSAAENDRVLNIVSNMLAVPFRLGAKRPELLKQYLSRACMFHREIVDALRRGDALRSEQVMRAHHLSLLNTDV